jgi:hypothetical protein
MMRYAKSHAQIDLLAGRSYSQIVDLARHRLVLHLA